jgi:hypothetical protein
MVMVQLHSASDQTQVLDTMIGLTRLSHRQRAIISGSGGIELCLGLRRRGFVRVATISTSWLPRRQHAIALLADRNPASLERALTEISPFLSANATIALLIDADEKNSIPGVRAKLQQMGFQIEAGVRCHQGLVLSACRQGFGQMEKAASPAMLSRKRNRPLSGCVPDAPAPSMRPALQTVMPDERNASRATSARGRAYSVVPGCTSSLPISGQTPPPHDGCGKPEWTRATRVGA